MPCFSSIRMPPHPRGGNANRRTSRRSESRFPAGVVNLVQSDPQESQPREILHPVTLPNRSCEPPTGRHCGRNRHARKAAANGRVRRRHHRVPRSTVRRRPGRDRARHAAGSCRHQSAPTIGRPRCSTPIEAANSGKPLTKFVVPSIGSTAHTKSSVGTVASISSPMMPCSWKRSARPYPDQRLDPVIHLRNRGSPEIFVRRGRLVLHREFAAQCRNDLRACQVRELDRHAFDGTQLRIGYLRSRLSDRVVVTHLSLHN